MLLTTPANRTWRRVGMIAAIFLLLSYSWYSRLMTPRGGTAIGLIYGGLGLCMIVFLLFQAVRKRWHRCVYGKNETWVNAHIYIGLLAMLVIFMHAGFRFHEISATVAAGLLSVVVVSGVIGAIFYTVIPRRLTEVEDNMTPEAVSGQMNMFAEKIQNMARGTSEAFRTVSRLLVEENSPAGWIGWRGIIGQGGGSQTLAVDRRLTEAIHAVPPGEQEKLKQMIALATQWRGLHSRFRTRMRLKNLLEVWLYLHIPFSAAMALAIIIHLLVVSYF